jgi:hypothetical protein
MIWRKCGRKSDLRAFTWWDLVKQSLKANVEIRT